MNIFDFGNARTYMREKWQSMKAVNAKYSARFFSKALGFGNPVYFLRIVNGERAIGDGIIDPLNKLFKHGSEEALYFRYLCYYSEETDPGRKEDLLEKLISLNHATRRHLLQSEFRFHREWHHSSIWAILDVIDCDGTDEDCQRLGTRTYPRLPAQKVKESLQLLQELSFIRKDEMGHWRPKEKSLSAQAWLHDEIVMQYWLKNLTMASQAILGKPKIPPRVYTNTFSCSEQAAALIHKKLDALSTTIRAIVTKDEGSKRVIHFQFQMFDQFQN